MHKNIYNVITNTRLMEPVAIQINSCFLYSLSLPPLPPPPLLPLSLFPSPSPPSLPSLPLPYSLLGMIWRWSLARRRK